VLLTRISQTAVDKIDLLFMIDNSVSMASKQQILQAAVPLLVARLVSPICVDASGAPTGETSANGVCSKGGATPEFPAISDIHIGIVSSSLGSHGGEVCASAGSATDTPDDKGELIGSRREPNWSGTPNPRLDFDSVTKSWNNSGFLAWDPTGAKNTPPGENDPTKLVKNFQDMIVATGEHGCGYEAQLEAWYRFLVDPAPPASVAKVNGATVRSSDVDPAQVDKVVLAQRAAFLRPDSLVAIVMMTDENDCSIRDDGLGWFVGALRASGPVVGPQHMPRGTSACVTNPNDPCCRSCGADETSPPTGCTALTADSECQKGTPPGTLSGQFEDSANLRCYNQHQRFGFDLLYPTSRYVQALTAPTLPSGADPTKQVPNPLFAAPPGTPARDPSLVFLAGIVGVPWQDLATADTLKDPKSLKYLSAKGLRDNGVWPMLVGDPSAPTGPIPPLDPFMRETTEPRSGMNPVTMDPIVPPTSINPTANPINGHEQNVPDKAELQYACTFKLATPEACATGNAACSCSPDLGSNPPTLNGVMAANSPLCQPPGGGPPTSTEYYAAGYPGTRELLVLRDLNDQGIVASICPKISDDKNSPSYGYNPAVSAIIDRVKGALRGRCLARALPKIANTTPTQVDCQVIEAVVGGTCDCSAEGRAPVRPETLPAVQRQLEASGLCGAAGLPPCDQACTCEIKQLTGADLSACVQGQETVAGFCYEDDPSSATLQQCPADQRQLLRFVDGKNTKTPLPGAMAFTACGGTQ